MRPFHLPDLGEGLDEAELISWHVNPGDRVVADQPLLSVETAKAVVEIPAPWSGRVSRLIGKPGETIKVGTVVAEFEDEGTPHADTGTVVGSLPAAESRPRKPAPVRTVSAVKATPAVRALAREMSIDLSTLQGTGPGGAITRADLEQSMAIPATASGYEPIRGVRRAMALNMARSAAEVPGSTVTDEAVVGHWSATEDVTLRLIKAMVAAAEAEPALNAWFDMKQMARMLHGHIDLGIAMNTGDGLFVPVLRDAGRREDADIRTALEHMKRDVAARKVAPADLQGQTITLSNFGMMGGLTASLAIVPPQVAILGAGRIFEAPRAIKGKVQVTKVLPLSLTFDHRVVTGAEAVRFLNAVMAALAPGDASVKE